jgi:palmitoyltransferase
MTEIVGQRFDYPWAFNLEPMLFIMIFVISICIGLAVLGMAIWHTYLIATGQTTIEYYMNGEKKEHSKYTGQVFVNEFDLGTLRNFKEFFNVGPHR